MRPLEKLNAYFLPDIRQFTFLGSHLIPFNKESKLTKRKPRDEHTPNPRTLTSPIEEQDERVRRNRARNRALSMLRHNRRNEFNQYYWAQLQLVGLEPKDE